MSKFNTALAGLSLILCFTSCNGQSKQSADCIASYKKAKTALNTYYGNNEQSLLQESLNNVEQAIRCEETKFKAIDLKISLLMLLKKYKTGYQFIDSLSEKDFSTGYKKKMNYNFFLAMEYESKKDTFNRNLVLNVVILDIQNYIQNEKMPVGKLDDQVYYDLYTIKSKILDQSKLSTEIDSLKKIYPGQEAFFESLKESFNDESKKSIPRSR
jgi:hypothetical protein